MPPAAGAAMADILTMKPNTSGADYAPSKKAWDAALNVISPANLPREVS